ncbi:hypothetical protein V3851_09800 [Paenibacillus sp. M1]|uniref:Butirosin biosynthesis protein H N-terminal domain-containing protein n=1 Tax=Paenibacillus haidiansis TaxID=1574488 RepID=A0ABU7VTC1_9BACL
MNALPELRKECNFKLAFMECFTSCVMTYIRLIGRDHRILLLDYWNLDYEFRTLMSSKNARNFPLDYLYGIDLKFQSGDAASLTEELRKGSSVILLCMASRLEYFPQAYLTMESSGFQHSVLIHGLDPLRGYAVFDPMTDYAGYLAPEAVAHAGKTGRNDTLHYFTLVQKKVDSLPTNREILEFCAGRNLVFYRGEKPETVNKVQDETGSDARWKIWYEWFANRRGGSQSFKYFIADLKDAPNWPQAKRDAWIKRNSTTISSIRLLRQQIWETYRDFMSLDQADAEEGERQIGEISEKWRRLNYLLLKFKSAGDRDNAIELMENKIAELQQSEMAFLAWLKQKAGEGHGSQQNR